MSYFFSLFLVAGLSVQGPSIADAQINGLPLQVADLPADIEPKEVPVRLSEVEIYQRLRNLPEWDTDGQTLFYTQTFPDFVAAIAFVNALVEPAEELAHHPDITINYDQVSLQLTTHDAGGLTDLDFQLAHRISQL
ncbi:MAG: 4a-hydroxytetrahydrobiopterin dehydratase [Cyanobacteria bacterium J06626_18]